MQIGSATSFLNSISQSLTPATGTSGVKSDSPGQNAKAQLNAANDEASKPALPQTTTPDSNARRGSYVNIVV